MVLKFYRRFVHFFNRRKNARLLGIKFRGAGKWQLPVSIKIGNKEIGLWLLPDHSTKTAFIDVFLDDCYGLAKFKKRFPAIHSILDVGANQGLFVLHAHNLFPGASIHAYEPNSLVIDNLAHHSNLVNARYYNEAVSLETGHTSLHNGADTLHGKTFFNETGEIVQTAISDCIRRAGGKVDLLKLDCEGAEWEILKDSRAMQSIKAITMEYHLDDEHLKDHHNSHQAIIDLLESLGFKIINHTISHEYWGVVWAERAS